MSGVNRVAGRDYDPGQDDEAASIMAECEAHKMDVFLYHCTQTVDCNYCGRPAYVRV